MIRQIIFIFILLAGYLFSPAFAVDKGPAYSFLKEPAVKWKDERLTGEVKNAPVKNLITELLRMAGSNWEVIGNLEGKMSISFDNLTINESVNKIMRISRYNYALIFEEQEPVDSMSSHSIKELTIYQENQRIRFSKTPGQIPVLREKKLRQSDPFDIGKTTVDLPSKPLTDKPQTLPRRSTTEEISALNKEMKAFADELLTEKKITQEEYNKLIGEL